MENREELLMEILKRVQRNYRHMVEIERVTKEMAVLSGACNTIWERTHKTYGK